MKSAEAFRKSIGGADEAFVRVIRQTLTDLEQEEAKPVKKKISTGLVLAMAIMLLTVTALAASQWGILDFIKEQGKTPAEEKLVNAIVQKSSESQWINATIDEALVDGNTAYLAMTIQPKTENTLIVPLTNDLSVPGGMAVMSNLEEGKELSIRAYADSKGFEQVIGIYQPVGDSLGKVQNARYETLEDGTLRCILELGFYQGPDNFPEKTRWCHWTIYAVAFGEDDALPTDRSAKESENVFLEAEIPVYICADTRKSRDADAHDIAGYNGYIDYITMTPMEDGSVQFTMMVDMNDSDEKEMYFLTADLVDGEGN